MVDFVKIENVNLLDAILEGDEIPIVLDERLVRFSYDSYLRGYHAYMNIWIPLIGDDSLNCEKEERNPHDPYAVAIFHNNRTVGHVPEI